VPLRAVGRDSGWVQGDPWIVGQIPVHQPLPARGVMRSKRRCPSGDPVQLLAVVVSEEFHGRYAACVGDHR